MLLREQAIKLKAKSAQVMVSGAVAYPAARYAGCGERAGRFAWLSHRDGGRRKPNRG